MDDRSLHLPIMTEGMRSSKGSFCSKSIIAWEKTSSRRLGVPLPRGVVPFAGRIFLVIRSNRPNSLQNRNEYDTINKEEN
jgi:hypothetical protein